MSANPARSWRVLLADDDAVLRERMARALRDRGHEVATAPDGSAALVLADSFEPDAAVLDLRMPGEDGLACLPRLLARHPEVRVVILTGYGSIASAMEAVRGGVWDYLTKPVDADQLMAVLARDEPRNEEGEGAVSAAPASLERVEWEHLQRVMADCGGNVSQAARMLGLHRRSLQRKLQKMPPPR